MLLLDPIWTDHQFKQDPRSCFVIMPFAEKWSGYLYTEFIKPLVAECGLQAIRADEMYGRNVLDDIWRGIVSSRLVVADISEPNENVFYELGIAHAVGKKVVLLSQNMDRVPFDLRNQRVIVYSDDHPGYTVLKRELPAHIASILEEPIDEIHHVRSIMGGYIVKEARQTVTLHADDPTTADIEDHMTILGVRDNVVLLNKVIERDAEFSNFSCNHRLVTGTDYPDRLRLAVMFDEPYVNTGTTVDVTISYTARGGFGGDSKDWEYDIETECEGLVFSLIAPKSYRGKAYIVERRTSHDFILQTLEAEEDGDTMRYSGTIENPEHRANYALKWD